MPPHIVRRDESLWRHYRLVTPSREGVVRVACTRWGNGWYDRHYRLWFPPCWVLPTPAFSGNDSGGWLGIAVGVLLRWPCWQFATNGHYFFYLASSDVCRFNYYYWHTLQSDSFMFTGVVCQPVKSERAETCLIAFSRGSTVENRTLHVSTRSRPESSPSPRGQFIELLFSIFFPHCWAPVIFYTYSSQPMLTYTWL